MNENHRRRVVLTGAWGGGKSTLIRELQGDPRYARSILVIPEAAPLVRSMGFDVHSPAFERCVVRLQHALEDAVDLPEDASDRRLLLAHRGTLDALAFWQLQGGSLGAFFDLVASSQQAELARYDAVLLLRSTAHGLPQAYQNYVQRCGRPPAEDALRLEALLEGAWQAHPRFFVVGNAGLSWAQKSALARAVIDARQRPDPPPSLAALNARLAEITYPSSHQYTIERDGHLQPCQAGAARLREIERVLPRDRWASLIDVGCAKGMFLLWALDRLRLEWAIGVEAAKDMVSACRQAIDFVGAPATILRGPLDGLHPILRPAELVLVLHCYHHLYFGSPFGTPSRSKGHSNMKGSEAAHSDGTPGAFSHDRLFALLSRITTDTLLFANPLTLRPDQVWHYQQLGIPGEAIQGYNRQAILESAGRYFDLQQFPLGGERPYILMRKKTL